MSVSSPGEPRKEARPGLCPGPAKSIALGTNNQAPTQHSCHQAQSGVPIRVKSVWVMTFVNRIKELHAAGRRLQLGHAIKRPSPGYPGLGHAIRRTAVIRRVTANGGEQPGTANHCLCKITGDHTNNSRKRRARCRARYSSSGRSISTRIAATLPPNPERGRLFRPYSARCCLEAGAGGAAPTAGCGM
jgi:hypothetical protein